MKNNSKYVNERQKYKSGFINILLRKHGTII